MTSIINTFQICGTLLIGTFLVLLAMPKSQLRYFLMEILGWSCTALAALYVFCPIDFIPDFIPVLGWIDDGGALIGAVAAAVTAISARADRQRLLSEQAHDERRLTYSRDDTTKQSS
jgi:uncharacterized membrane protein YkvA (DUF1232 family)